MLLDRLTPFSALSRDLDRMFLTPANGNRSARYPRVIIRQTQAGFELKAQVPGIAADDLDVTVHGNTVTLRGKLAEAKAEDEASFLLREWHQHEFERSFEFPADLDEQAVVAELRDGVLRLELPLAAHQKPQKIQVKTAK
jgi:HSP20 family protein